MILALLAALVGGCTRQPVELSEPKVSPRVGLETAANASVDAERSTAMTLKLGMPKSEVSRILHDLGADDRSAGMQVTANAPKSDWVWRLTSPNITLETEYEDERLAVMDLWDWRGRKQTRYQSLMRHDRIASLTIHANRTFDTEIIETRNADRD